MMTKKEIPNISPKSGISLDYLLALGHVKNFLERKENKESNRSIFLAMRSLKHRKVFLYQERFRQDEYDSPIDDKNKDVVNKINGLVELMNREREDISLNDADFEDKYQKISSIYYEIKRTIEDGLS